MSWHAKVTRYTDNDAEIAVHVDYFDNDPREATVRKVHHEEATFPAGTPKRAIREYFAVAGRSMRQARGRSATKDSMVDETFAIDDI